VALGISFQVKSDDFRGHLSQSFGCTFKACPGYGLMSDGAWLLWLRVCVCRSRCGMVWTSASCPGTSPTWPTCRRYDNPRHAATGGLVGGVD
jgi:hypothetical protein